MTEDSGIQLSRELEQYLSGDSKRFRALKDKLSYYITQRLPDIGIDPDDLVSEIFSIALLSLRSGQFRGDNVKAFNGYLYGIARLKILKAIEKAGRINDLAMNLRSGDIPIGRITDPETKVSRGDLLKKIYDEMGEPCRELIRLKFTYGWSDQEIANHRNMSKNATSTAISRCLKRARELKIVQELLYKSPGSED